MKAGDIFDNPMYHFSAFGLGNPIVQWAVERSLYDEWCPACGGRGVEVRRPCYCTDGGCDKLPGEWPAIACRRSEGGCPHCAQVCELCQGARLRPLARPHVVDCGDEASIELAAALKLDRVRGFYQPERAPLRR